MWFCTPDQVRIDTLTITNSRTRFLIDVHIVPPTIDDSCFSPARSEHMGCPYRSAGDDGAPFGSNGTGGLTRISV